MAQGENLQNYVSDFLSEWKRHPLSIPIILLIIVFFFFLLLIQGGITSEKIWLAIIFAFFNYLIFSKVIKVLIKHKFAFYNINDLAKGEIIHRIHTLKESLINFPIGIGFTFDELKKPIPDEIKEQVTAFETLSDVLIHGGIKY